MNKPVSYYQCKDEVEKLGFKLLFSKNTENSMKTTYTLYDPANDVKIFNCDGILESYQSAIILAWCEGYKYQLKEAYQL